MEHKNLNTEETANSDLGAVSGSAFVMGQEKSGRMVCLRAGEISELLPDKKDKHSCIVIMKNGNKYRIGRNLEGLLDAIGGISY